MTFDEFEREAIGSGLAPDVFKNDYAEFRKLQCLAWDAVKEFCRVCEKNHISYMLCFGSLLGTIRDSGLSPPGYFVVNQTGVRTNLWTLPNPYIRDIS